MENYKRITVEKGFDCYKAILFFSYDKEYENKELKILYKNYEKHQVGKEKFKFKKGGLSTFQYDLKLIENMSSRYYHIDFYSTENLNFEFWAIEN